MKLRGREISRIIIQIDKEERYKIGNVEEMIEIVEQINLYDLLTIKWLGHLKVVMMMNIPHLNVHGEQCEEIIIGCDRIGTSTTKLLAF